MRFLIFSLFAILGLLVSGLETGTSQNSFAPLSFTRVDKAVCENGLLYFTDVLSVNGDCGLLAQHHYSHHSHASHFSRVSDL
jgi:hypothetical protein